METNEPIYRVYSWCACGNPDEDEKYFRLRERAEEYETSLKTRYNSGHVHVSLEEIEFSD